MSLIEALVSIAILSAAILALAQMMGNFGALNKTINVSTNYGTFTNELNNILRSEAQCRQMLMNKVVPAAAGTSTPITLTIKNQTYDPAAVGGPGYLYGDRSSSLRITAITLERSNVAPADVRYDSNPSPTVITMTNGRRYFVYLNVRVESDGSTARVFRKDKQFGIAVITDPVTRQIRSCFGEDSLAMACERLGGSYDPTLPPSQRCNLASAMGGCIGGGSYTRIGSPSGTNCGSGGSPNPTTGRCSCPTNFSSNLTMSFVGVVGGSNQNIRVYHCYRCDDSVSTPPYVP